MQSLLNIYRYLQVSVDACIAWYSFLSKHNTHSALKSLYYHQELFNLSEQKAHHTFPTDNLKNN